MIFVLRIAPQNRVCPTKCQGAFSWFKIFWRVWGSTTTFMIWRGQKNSPTPASGKKR
jgi:hypothetical protein